MPSPGVASGVRKADHLAHSLLAQAAAPGIQIGDSDIHRVLELLFSGKPRQDRFAANPSGRQFVVGSTLGAVGYSGRVFLKKGATPWYLTRHVIRLLNAWRDQRLGITCEEDDLVRPTTIQVNRTSKDSPGVDLHIDGNNCGVSEIVLLGAFSGGGFFLEEATAAFSVERELVCSSGSSSSGLTRTPGIYKGRIHKPPCGVFTRFEGSKLLHRGEPVSDGIRFSLVWFSLNERYLQRMDDTLRTELIAKGFRPRRAAELQSLPKTLSRVSNDSRQHPLGFLVFARSHRLDVELELQKELEVIPGEATRILKSRWASLGAGDARGERGYFAALERIECKKKGKEADEARDEDQGVTGHRSLADAPILRLLRKGAVKEEEHTSAAVVATQQQANAASYLQREGAPDLRDHDVLGQHLVVSQLQPDIVLEEDPPVHHDHHAPSHEFELQSEIMFEQHPREDPPDHHDRNAPSNEFEQQSEIMFEQHLREEFNVHEIESQSLADVVLGAYSEGNPGQHDDDDHVLVDNVLHDNDQEDSDLHELELQSLADIVLEEYPRALRDTDLFIDVLNQFGIAVDPLVRSRALEILSDKQEDARARTLADRIASAEQRGEPESAIRSLRSSSGMPSEYLQGALVARSPKRLRLLDASSSASADHVVVLDTQECEPVHGFEQASTCQSTVATRPEGYHTVVVLDTQECGHTVDLEASSKQSGMASHSEEHPCVGFASISGERKDSEDAAVTPSPRRCFPSVVSPPTSTDNVIDVESQEPVQSGAPVPTEQLMMVERIQGLGFKSEHAEQAAARYSSIDAAVDWIVRSFL